MIGGAAVGGTIDIETDAPIPTWFGIGGRADRLARPTSAAQVRACLDIDPSLRVLGDGANLLVDDDGVGELVVASSGLSEVRWGADGGVFVGAGAGLPALINECVRRGLGGLEGLGGIPASLGGAVIMNAGGAFGQIADAVERVHAMDRTGREFVRARHEIGFGYRCSGLNDLVVTGVELRLTPGDPGRLRLRLLEVMAYKKASQPMADRSAGCVFKNPIAPPGLRLGDEEIAFGSRVSAGRLIDLAGCKGLRVGGARVSERHANFIVTEGGARAGDVIALMGLVAERVLERFGAALEPEVVVWRRRG